MRCIFDFADAYARGHSAAEKLKIGRYRELVDTDAGAASFEEQHVAPLTFEGAETHFPQAPPSSDNLEGEAFMQRDARFISRKDAGYRSPVSQAIAPTD